MKKLYGAGMKFFATPEEFDKVYAEVSLLYPLAEVEVIEKEIELPELTIEEKILLGLIDESVISREYNKDSEYSEETDRYSPFDNTEEICFAA